MKLILFIQWMTICHIITIRKYFPEKAVTTHSSTLAWKIPWTEEPGGLQSMRSWRVGQDWATSLSYFTFIHWRRKWQPTPVSLPGESQGWRGLVGCHLWGYTELDTTEVTQQQQQQKQRMQEQRFPKGKSGFCYQNKWEGILGRLLFSSSVMSNSSSTLACKIPWMEEPGRLQSMG